MANLGTFTIINSDYEKLAELTELTFEEGKTYTIQIYNPAFIREGTIGNGFYIFDNKPFQYTAGSNDLYIKVKGERCEINIAE